MFWMLSVELFNNSPLNLVIWKEMYLYNIIQWCIQDDAYNYEGTVKQRMYSTYVTANSIGTKLFLVWTNLEPFPLELDNHFIITQHHRDGGLTWHKQITKPDWLKLPIFCNSHNLNAWCDLESLLGNRLYGSRSDFISHDIKFNYILIDIYVNRCTVFKEFTKNPKMSINKEGRNQRQRQTKPKRRS